MIKENPSSDHEIVEKYFGFDSILNVFLIKEVG
jgi:hypothetical protein